MNAAALLFLAAVLLPAQDVQTISKTFNVTAGSNAKKLLVDNVTGFIHVTGYSGAEIRIAAKRTTTSESKEALADAQREVKLDFSQQGNFVRVYEDGPFRDQDGGNHYRSDRYYGYTVTFDYEIQVPSDTELILKTVNHGDISVARTAAPFELRNVNGAISLDAVSGAGTVNTVNGAVTAHFARNPAQPCSFKTLNGQMDLYFQPGLSADLRFKTFNGHIYTDFDVDALPVPTAETESKNGRFVYRNNRTSAARVGRGGPELSFDAFNGNIRLHTKSPKGN